LSEEKNDNHAVISILNTICELIRFKFAEAWAVDAEQNVLRYTLGLNNTVLPTVCMLKLH